MADLSTIPLQDGFETQLSQEWNGATGTVYVLSTPSYTPTTTDTYVVVSPGKTNMQIARVSDYDSTAKTLTIDSISFEKALGVSSTAQTHPTGSKVIISDNYQFWEDIQTAVNSKLDKDGGNVQTYTTTAARDSALGGDGVATLPYSDIYVTNTGLFYNYNLNIGQWQVVSTGTAPANATTSTAGVMRTDVAPSGIPVALISDNPKYSALAGVGTPSSSNLYETQFDSSNGSTKTATTISFVSGTKTIADSGNGLVTAGFKQGTQITVTGSASNNSTFTIVSVAAGAIVVAESIVTESAGASVTITSVTADKNARYSSTGQLKVPATPVASNDAASKSYVDNNTNTPTCVSIIPTPNYPTAGTTAGKNTGANTTAGVGSFILPTKITVNKLSFNVTTATTVGNSPDIRIGIYSEDGQTQLISASATITGTIIHTITLGSPVELTAGNYYAVWCSVGTSNFAISAYTAIATPALAGGVSGEPILAGTLTITAGTLPTTFSPTAITSSISYTACIRLDN